uniref:Uncharacterized protein n=1 Tax=Serinus canaria TaxID=9135 RepID=A0A8C9UEX4_SERCA
MRYPLVPLVNELTFPLLFFWFCLPFVMLLIIAIIWLQLLLNEGKLGNPWQSRPPLVTATAAWQREGNSLKKKPTPH